MQAIERIPVARISKSFGLSGELLIQMFDTFPADFDTREPLFVLIDKLAVPLFCDRFERRGRRGALVVFSDFDTERRTNELIGCELFINRHAVEPAQNRLVPDSDELFPEDLVGFKATLDGGSEGVIQAYIDGENPLFLIRIGDKEIYVPVVDEFITEIDVESRNIGFDLPEGLMDLNE